MQKSYTDCAIHIVCIFGLTGEVFSQIPVGGYCDGTFNYHINNDTLFQLQD